MRPQSLSFFFHGYLVQCCDISSGESVPKVKCLNLMKCVLPHFLCSVDVHMAVSFAFYLANTVSKSKIQSAADVWFRIIMLLLLYLTTNLLVAAMPLHPTSPIAIFSSSPSAWANSTGALFTSSLRTWMASTSGSVHSTSGHISFWRTASGFGYQRSLPWGAGRRFAQHFELKRRRRPNKAALGEVWC